MILDIICGAILVVFGLIGLFKGFAKQIFGILSPIAAIFGAYLLLMPVYTLCYDMFLGGIVESVKGVFAGFAFLGENSAIWAERVVLIVLYIVLFIVCALVWKLLKLICFPICDRRFWRFFDRIFGLALGLCWGALLAGGILYILYLAQGWSFVPAGINDAISSIIASLSEGSYVIKPYFLDNIGLVEKFFADIWDLIVKGFSAIKAA